MDPGKVSLEQYRTWLNDAWFQKITNTLHDTFCVGGLDVGSQVKPKLFKIYGDGNMLRSDEGAKETATTSRMSINAINDLAAFRRAQLTAMPGARPVKPPRPVESIMTHFPDQVSWNGQTYSLKDWATGAPMTTLVHNAMDKALNSKIIKPYSAFKGFTGGLAPEHTPF
jgi:hypothetical protein